jgi:hypothetical protein
MLARCGRVPLPCHILKVESDGDPSGRAPSTNSSRRAGSQPAEFRHFTQLSKIKSPSQFARGFSSLYVRAGATRTYQSEHPRLNIALVLAADGGLVLSEVKDHGRRTFFC